MAIAPISMPPMSPIPSLTTFYAVVRTSIARVYLVLPAWIAVDGVSPPVGAVGPGSRENCLLGM